MAYDNTNRGSLFKETEKKHENSPDYAGKLDVGGKEYRIAGWLKVAQSGRRYMSLSVTPMDAQKDARTHSERKARQDDDSIPPF